MTSPVTTPGVAVSLRGVSKNFRSGKGAEVDTVNALKSVNLDVREGEFLTVVGASGCGKSTMLTLIADLEQPSQGTLQVNGRVAFMFQEATLLPWLTAKENIELALKLRGVGRGERDAEARRLLKVVNLDGWDDRRPHELSGGMRQRVALARCLAQGAQVILMDEPLGALDAMTRDHLHDEIESVVKSEGLTVIFVTHNMREAVRLGDRVILMGSRPGRVVYEQIVGLSRPRKMDSPEIAVRAAELTERLRESM